MLKFFSDLIPATNVKNTFEYKDSDDLILCNKCNERGFLTVSDMIIVPLCK